MCKNQDLATRSISRQASDSRRVEAGLRKTAALYNLLAKHILGSEQDHLPPCAQCAEKNTHPRRRRLSYCAAGALFQSDVYEAYAQVWYDVAEARRRAGHRARGVPGAFSMQAEIVHFLDFEFEVPGKPPGLRRRPANMFKIEEIIIGPQAGQRVRR